MQANALCEWTASEAQVVGYFSQKRVFAKRIDLDAEFGAAHREFVAVDGFGEKSAVPIHRWSKLMNDRKIERVRKRLLSAVPARLTKPATV